MKDIPNPRTTLTPGKYLQSNSDPEPRRKVHRTSISRFIVPSSIIHSLDLTFVVTLLSNIFHIKEGSKNDLPFLTH